MIEKLFFINRITAPETNNTISNEERILEMDNQIDATNENKPKNEILSDMLKEGIQKVMDSEEFKNWCVSVSNLYFNKYSLRNMMLVYLQKENATYTMGYQEWKKYGRQVAGGEKSIEILAPVFEKEKNKGDLLRFIKNSINQQFKDNPTLNYAVFTLPYTKVSFNGYKNGLYDVSFNNKIVGSKLTEDELRKFINSCILGKVAVGFRAIPVFDVSQCITPEYLYVKSDFTKDEVVYENGKPVKNRKGETKIKNSQERINRLLSNLDYKINNDDIEKMNLLFDVLKKVSENKGVPISIETIDKDGVKGFFTHNDNRIVIGDKNNETERNAVTLHEMAHADLHYKNHDISRQMKEVQAEAVAFIVGQNFGIETDISSFHYIASWSAGRDLKELEDSLDVILKQSNKLMDEIKDELDARGYDLNLELKDKQPISNEQVSDILRENKEIILNKSRMVEVQKDDAIRQLKLSSNEKEQEIIKERIGNLIKLEDKLSNYDTILTRLENFQDDIKTQSYVINQIDHYKASIDELSKRNEDLLQEHILHMQDMKREMMQTFKEEYNNNPFECLKTWQKNNEKLQSLSDLDLQFVANSEYVSENFNRYIINNHDKFIDKIVDYANLSNTVKSKNGSFVEITFCENWLDKPIFENGSLCHPKTANKIFEQAEIDVRELKKQAQKDGEYFPYAKCKLIVYTANEKSLTLAKSRIDIGDGYQKNMIDALSQETTSDINYETLMDNLSKSIKERISKDKIASPLINEINNVEKKEGIKEKIKQVEAIKNNATNNKSSKNINKEETYK